MDLNDHVTFKKTFRTDFANINVSVQSRRGSGRDSNQDRFMIDRIHQDELIAAVADGMGGAAGGDIAAQMAVAGIKTFYRSGPDPERELGRNFAAIDRKLHAYGQKAKGLQNMGTTLTGFVLRDKTAFWAHIGDTRLYLYREHNLHQITTDQTRVEKMFKNKEITREQKKTHHLQHILSQCVGRGRCVPETGSHELKKKDLLLLSSDGIHKVLDRPALELVLNSNDTEKEKASALINEAQKAFGTDDMTVLLVQV